MTEYDVTLKICTLYKGVPYGPALISFKDPDNLVESFQGIGIFNDGKLDSGPFSFIKRTGFASSYSLMKNGRPADSNYGTWFNEPKSKEFVDSLTEKKDVSG